MTKKEVNSLHRFHILQSVQESAHQWEQELVVVLAQELVHQWEQEWVVELV